MTGCVGSTFCTQGPSSPWLYCSWIYTTTYAISAYHH